MPIPCSGIAQGQVGVASFDLIRELGFFMDAGCCTQFQRLRQPGTGTTAVVPSLFHRGRTFPVPKGTALHGSWITAMWIHMDPVSPASDPTPGALGAARKCSQPGMEQRERGQDDPQEGMG